MKKSECQKTIQNIRTELRNYIEKYNLKALIIGQSGGIDSALCTVLASPVCKELGIELIGRSLTIESNKPDEIERGEKIGQYFCTNFKAIDLTNSYLALRDTIEENGKEQETGRKIRRGNIKARVRMIYLYNLAQQHKGIVLSTDNYTEFLEGFWTLHGDVGDFGMIQELWKTEVYEIAQWIADNELSETSEKEALQECIDAISTDGLGISNSDLEQLGANSYQEVDIILKDYLNGNKKITSPVIDRHLSSDYKRNNPFNLKRELIIH